MYFSSELSVEPEHTRKVLEHHMNTVPIVRITTTKTPSTIKKPSTATKQ
jgi:hypothetical protein